jgi:hypothetical protein
MFKGQAVFYDYWPLEDGKEGLTQNVITIARWGKSQTSADFIYIMMEACKQTYFLKLPYQLLVMTLQTY